jgi:lipopolysaccharide export system permease protein
VKIIDRYIAIGLAKGYSVVALGLLVVFSLLALLLELENLNEGKYELADALLYVTLSAPDRILVLAPFCALLGGVVALEKLVLSNELVIIRCSGVSQARLAWSVGKPAIALVIITAVTIQFISPPLHQLASKRQASTAIGDLYAITRSGIWTRDQGRVLRVEKMRHGQIPADVELYQFDTHGRLQSYVRADLANIGDKGKWQLINVRRKQISESALIQEQHAHLNWPSFVSRSQLRALQMPPGSLSPTSIYQYIRYLEQTEQRTEQFALIFWQKVFLPLSVGIMAMLALPLAANPIRKTRTLWNVMLAGGLGAFLFVIGQVVVGAGSAFGLSPFLIGALPPSVMVCIGFTMFRQMHDFRKG